MKKYWFIIFIIVLLGSEAYSQGKSKWLGVGGAVSAGSSTTLTADFNFQTGRHLYFSLMADTHDYFSHITMSPGIGVGYIFKSNPLLLALSSGLTYDASNTVLINENPAGIGIPIKLQTYLSTKIIGIGLNGIVKFSNYGNYGGIGLVLGLGKMW